MLFVSATSSLKEPRSHSNATGAQYDLKNTFSETYGHVQWGPDRFFVSPVSVSKSRKWSYVSGYKSRKWLYPVIKITPRISYNHLANWLYPVITG